MTKRYTCRGSVRGPCGVMHRSPSAAFACCHLDQVACESQGGYSDREVRAVEPDGSLRRLTDDEVGRTSDFS